MESLIINGVVMPDLKKEGLDIGDEPVWSTHTGRSASAVMIGDIKAIKCTLKCTWPQLSQEDAAKIRTAVSPSFFPVTFTDVGGARVTKTFYSGPRTYSVYSYAKGMKTYKSVTLDLIEK